MASSPRISTTLIVLTILPFTTAASITKRDEGYLLPKSVIILLVILGSGLAVCMGFAIHKTFGFRRSGNGMKNVSAEQMSHMKEVRERNYACMMAEGHRTRMERTDARGVRKGESAYS
jgi:hypothetical protein